MAVHKPTEGAQQRGDGITEAERARRPSEKRLRQSIHSRQSAPLVTQSERAADPEGTPVRGTHSEGILPGAAH